MSAVRKPFNNVRPIRPAKLAELDWLSPAQVRECYGFTLSHLQDMRDKGRGPRYHKPTQKTVLYDPADIDAWIAAAVVPTRDQPCSPCAGRWESRPEWLPSARRTHLSGLWRHELG